jgi:high-affinity nickel-transport protein
MINLVAIIGLGSLLGMRHATDPDHVVAVTTIVSRERNLKQAALIGIAWGAGHTLTILGVGSAMILFRIVLPPRLGLAMELAVAVMLVLLGIRNMGGLFGFAAPKGESAASSRHEHQHFHAHGDYIHAHDHAHAHNPERTPLTLIDRWFRGMHVYDFVRPLVVGIVHGLAGSAAIALLVLSTIQSVRWAVAYLLIFGVGTIIGMMLITMSIASAFTLGQKRLAKIGRHFGFAAGAVSLVFGLFLAYHITFVDGLFTLHPLWIPH